MQWHEIEKRTGEEHDQRQRGQAGERAEPGGLPAAHRGHRQHDGQRLDRFDQRAQKGGQYCGGSCGGPGHREALMLAASMVVIFVPATVETCVMHARTGWPSAWTRQRPPSAMPQPKLVVVT